MQSRCLSYPLMCPAGPKADIYHAARVGDLERIKHLVEDEEVDVNRRDRWDSVPLYYACLAGVHTLAAPFVFDPPLPASKLRVPARHAPMQGRAMWRTTCWRPEQSAMSTPLTGTAATTQLSLPPSGAATPLSIVTGHDGVCRHAYKRVAWCMLSGHVYLGCLLTRYLLLVLLPWQTLRPTPHAQLLTE